MRTETSLVSDEFAQKFAAERETPYTRWVRSEGLDIISSFYVPNLHTVELRPWARRGGRGVFLNHDASRSSNDCCVCEIAPGGQLNPQRQLFEEMIYVLDGRGSTVVWNDAGKRIAFEWKAGAMFAIPLNTWHQHFNGSGIEPARYVAVTNAPVIINAFGDVHFVFDTKYDFTDRFNGEPDYFSGKGESRGLLLDTNFVADAVNLPLHAATERGAGGGHTRFSMARGHMTSHISQFPVGTYKKAHAHGPGAHVIIMSGEGYTLMWSEGGEPKKYEWREGSMIVPPNMWYHQHFNTGTIPARYLAFKAEGVSIRNAQGVPKAWISKRLGGDQIDYVDESPTIREWFREALARRGLEPRMEKAYEAEQAELGT
ncbi:MAG: cupin domain-containing protein [Acidobacteria bacterium]|nr:cupin domain-containing protein [Acidobacteriota bacterium]